MLTKAVEISRYVLLMNFNTYLSQIPNTMKNNKILSIILLLLFITISFTSCKRNDPVPEIDQEEFNEVKVTFTNLSNKDDLVVVTINKEGNPSKEFYSLFKNETYLMEIELYNNSTSINDELIEDIDEHQFFFIAPSDAINSYTYKDDNLGLKGEIKFAERTNEFAFNIILRHGLTKSHPAAQNWNSANFAEAGGADDLSTTFKIKLLDND